MLCFGRYFFFQAEDGIRDHCVTGVQTCALPILVARVVLFAAVTDSIGTQSVPWVASHMTPSDRYYGLAHDRDSFFRPIRASWDSLGMAAFGPAVAPETCEQDDGLTHILLNIVPARGGCVVEK